MRLDNLCVESTLEVGVPSMLRDITEYFGDSFCSVSQSMDVFNTLSDFLCLFDKAMADSLRIGVHVLHSTKTSVEGSPEEKDPAAMTYLQQQTQNVVIFEHGSVPPPPGPPPPPLRM